MCPEMTCAVHIIAYTICTSLFSQYSFCFAFITGPSKQYKVNLPNTAPEALVAATNAIPPAITALGSTPYIVNIVKNTC